MQVPAPAPVIGGICPYLTVEGANAAGDFYVKAFGAEDVSRIPPDDKGRTMHVHVRINGNSLMLSDAYPEHGHAFVPIQGFNLHLQVDDIDAWFQRATEAGATVVMPIHDAFWGDRYAMLKDPFGVTWAMGMTPKG